METTFAEDAKKRPEIAAFVSIEPGTVDCEALINRLMRALNPSFTQNSTVGSQV
jgi:hypothetical protein